MHLVKYSEGWTRRHFLDQLGKGIFAAGIQSPLMDVIGRNGNCDAAYPFVPGHPPGLLQLKAPLSRWSQMDSSDSTSGCDEQRNNMVRMYRSGDMTSMATQFNLWLYHNSVCVFSADPRLRRFDKEVSHDR